jgi:hypothetical protein
MILGDRVLEENRWYEETKTTYLERMARKPKSKKEK